MPQSFPVRKDVVFDPVVHAVGGVDCAAGKTRSPAAWRER